MRRAIRIELAVAGLRGSGAGGVQMVENLNRQRLLKFFESCYSGDIEATLARCSDDIEFVSNAPTDILPHMGPHKGKDEVRRMWETVRSRYSEMRYDLHILVVDGERAAANVRAFLRKAGNQRMVQFDLAVFFTFKDGRITHIREIMDTFDLVQQVLERDLFAELTGSKPHED